MLAKRTMGRTTLLALLAVTAQAGGPARRPVHPGVQAATSGPASTAVTDEAPGLVFALSEGAAEAAPTTTDARPATQALGEHALAAVLSRLPALEAATDDRQDVALRERSLPAPRTGRTLPVAFAPASGATTGVPDASATTLQVLRFAPEGEVPLAAQLSLTFSQPMVPVTTLDQLAAEAVPVRLQPAPPGQWRWLGTRTLVFEPAQRFAMATHYSVEVPTGTRATHGATLAQALRFTFATPPLGVTASHPNSGPVRRDTLMAVAFDQRIDPAAVLAAVSVRAAGRSFPVRAASAEELAGDPAVAALLAAHPERALAFRTQAALPADSAVTVTLAAGAPSAEGPRKTTKEQQWRFTTYGPLRVAGHSCGWGERGCRPLDAFGIEFSNPLDRRAFRAPQVRVEPAIPNLRVSIAGNHMTLEGRTRGRTRYTVHLAPELSDQFGQALGSTAALSFDVGPAEESFTTALDTFVVLEPGRAARLPVFTTNVQRLRLRAYAVSPQDWPAFHAFQRDPERALAPGRRLLDQLVPLTARPDSLVETALDLSAAFPAKLGHAVVVVEPVPMPKEQWRRQRYVGWIQSTRLGLSAFVDASTLVAWANDLASGRPAADVELRLEPSGLTATTDAQGLARVALGERNNGLLVARRGQDVAMLPESPSWYDQSGGTWHSSRQRPRLVFHVLDDRGMYRPGEQARLKGWLRRVGQGVGGDVTGAPEGLRQLRYRLLDSRGNEVTQGECALNAWGAFDFAVALPATMNLGAANLTIETVDALGVDTQPYVHTLQVQEFRRPEFEVRAEASAGPHVVGGHANLSVSAAYYAGGALPDAEVAWSVVASTASYAPPGHDEFTFGEWLPWRKQHERPQRDERREQFAGRTDARGRHALRVDFKSVRPARPSTLRAEASVSDVNRQAWTASTTLLVHAADVYVGLRSARPFFDRGQPLEVDTLTVDIDGQAAAERPVEVEAQRLEWQQTDDGEWREQVAERETCTLVSTGAAQPCRFLPRHGGRWRVQAAVRDARGRENTSALEVWVAGEERPQARGVEQQSVTLVPDRRDYAAGDTAQVLVVAPFVPAEGLLTVRRSGLVRTQRFRMETATQTLGIAIEEGFTPNVHVQVDLNGSAPRDDGAAETRATATRPAFASGTLSLDVPARARSLALRVVPRQARLEPGGKTVLDVELRDAQGRPVSGGEVAVIVADEAVLALSNYTLRDPLATFYPTREAGVRDHHLRASVLLGSPEPPAGALSAGGPALETLAYAADGLAPAPAPQARPMRMAKAAGAEPSAPEPIRTRVDWNALALFAASLPTDAQGRAQVEVKLPDSLTRYRVMAVAVEGARRFGKTETTLTARLPLMVRPSPPRFLNFGDRFELPVVVQNQTDDALDVDVAVRATNAWLTGNPGQRVRVPANERLELRFPVTAERAGTARFQVAAVAGQASDAAQFSLPVWTPATSEAFATYGTLDAGHVQQPLRRPLAVLPQFGGLEVTLSSTAMQALTDAVLYLASYPYECSEQLASKVLAVAALRDVLAAFQAEGLPAPDALEAALARDIERLRALQNADGGFAFWRRGDESWPYLGVHVTHALERARAKGFAVPEELLQRAHGYVRALETHIPTWYSLEARRTLIAYGLHVRQRLGDTDAARARRLVKEAGVEGLSFEALGWLLPVLAKDAGSQAELALVRRHLANRVVESAGAAHFAVRYSDGDHVLLHSDRRADAVLLEALVAVDPRSDLIPKLVEGLLAHRKAGRWESTQENAFVLLALGRYFDTYEKVTPDFVARLWLGERYTGEQPFRGRSAERRRLDVPMAGLLATAPGAADVPLVLSKEGAGRLYYRIGLRYAPANLELAPREAGFTVTRRYEGLDDAADVRRGADGRWHVKAGARVRVVLTLVAPARRYHVALVDPLPAGLEAENPALATTGSLPPPAPEDVTVLGAPGVGGPGRPGPFWRFWTRPWFEHQNLRDERVEAFSSLVWEGVYSYAYVARATTPGTFVAPPTKAEEMYHPETFGRSGSDWLVVE
jgi:hypothetical protein